MVRKYWKLPSGEIVTTPKRFGDELGVTRQNVYFWIERGLPIVKSEDRKIMILYREALEWLREQKWLGNIRLSFIPNVSIEVDVSNSQDNIWGKVLELIDAGSGAYVLYEVLKNFFERGGNQSGNKEKRFEESNI